MYSGYSAALYARIKANESSKTNTNTKTKAAYTGRRNDENEAKKERRFFGTSSA